MNAKISVFVIFVEVIIYLLLYNLHDCAYNEHLFTAASTWNISFYNKTQNHYYIFNDHLTFYKSVSFLFIQICVLVIGVILNTACEIFY